MPAFFPVLDILVIINLPHRKGQTAHMCAIEVGAVLSRGTPPPPQLIYVFAGSAGNFRSTWDYVALRSYGLIKLSPVHILNVSRNLLHRSRNVPSPTDASRTPSASCLGGRSLVLRSLRLASSGSANIIHVIVSCCALFLFVLVWNWVRRRRCAW